MQIHLYDDYGLSKDTSRYLGKLRNSSFVYDRRCISSIVETGSETPRDMIEKITMLTRTNRVYHCIFNNYVDSHFLAELLGMSETSFNTNYLISVENRLDLILSILSGADPNKIRNIQDYEEVSHNLLNLNITKLDISLERFFGVDDNLDDYFHKILTGIEEESLEILMRDIMTTATSILSYTGLYLNRTVFSSMKSISKGKICIGSNQSEIDDVTILFKGNEYKLDIIKCEKWNLKDIIGLEVYRI